MSFLLLLLVVAGAVVFSLVLLLTSASKRSGNMGINLTPPKQCPKCGAALPLIRAPKNLRQALWGGCTCASCNVELDKWGNVVEP